MADELVIGTVTAAAQQPGARAPALLLTLDLGTYGSEQAVMQAGGHDADALVGKGAALDEEGRPGRRAGSRADAAPLRVTRERVERPPVAGEEDLAELRGSDGDRRADLSMACGAACARRARKRGRASAEARTRGEGSA